MFVHQQRGAAAKFGKYAKYDEADKGGECIIRRIAMRRGHRQLHGFGKRHRIRFRA